ncbi:copper chaperone PCu(A)C [Paraglaciecola marina]|uniref:copper chaperone PCu(A)C n=1 Tax=Paraglaciecola marina TaxID=2500157 RepID=UPI0010602544|nr:copper chaperone PCu(A)C [Paraglaciecola marina]
MLRVFTVLLGISCFWCQAELVVSDATVRLLPPGVPNTSAYLSIENLSNKAEIIVAASSNIANKAELHNHVLVNDMMSMQQQDSIIIEPGQTVYFKPGGLHIMLFGLKQTLVENQEVSLKLITQDGDAIDFKATVARPSHATHH